MMHHHRFVCATRATRAQDNALFRVALVVFFALVTLVTLPDPAQADELDEIRRLYNAGFEAYDYFEYDTAETNFDQAAEVAKSSGTRDPIVAKVYIAKGILFHARFKDTAPEVARDKTFDEFVAAVSINYSIDLPDDYRSDELEEILKRAREIVPPPQNASSGGGGTVRLSHDTIAVADACQPVTVRANVPAHPEAFRAYLHYRSSDAVTYEASELEPDPADPEVLMADIPIEATTAATIDYYIEVQNRQQAAVASVGSRAQPMTITVIGECVIKAESRPIVQMFVGVGGGVGLASGESERCRSSVNCVGENPDAFQGVQTGLAPAPFHVDGELMFNVVPEVQLGVYFRYQIIEPAMMFGGKVRYFLLNDQTNRFYTGLGLGYGDATYVVNLGPDFNNFSDIVRAKGPMHVGFNLGYMVAFHDYFGLQFDVYAPIHFPEFTFHFDVNAGPYVHF